MINVAKTYSSWEKIGEPFIENKKSYIYVRKSATSTPKKVRAYSDSEYIKLYPEEKAENIAKTRIIPYKDVLGFIKDYITIFKGDIDLENEYFNVGPVFRYATLWGWYMPSNFTLPDDLPSEIEPIILNKDLVFISDNELKPFEEIETNVRNLLYDKQIGTFVGKVNDRIVRTVTLHSTTEQNNNFGIKYIHNFLDDEGNYYSWTTSTTNTYIVNKKYQITGTIKELKTNKNKNINELTRCKLLEV